MNAVLHDFTKPGRLIAEWQHRLTGWFRQAFALANKAWGKQLPFPVEASFLDLDVCYAKKGVSALAEGVVGYPVLVADRRLTTFFTMPRSSLLQLVGAMLGDTDAAGKDREMTLIEENLADYFLVHFWLPFFREAWPNADLVTWELQPRESNPQCSRVFPATEILVVLSWQLRGPWGESNGVWFFQKKGLLDTLGDSPGLTATPVPEAIVACRRETIVSTLPVSVEVVVGTAELKLSELSQLQVGDVVMLEQANEAGVVVRAGGRDLFRGKAGRLGSRKAFQIDAIGES